MRLRAAIPTPLQLLSSWKLSVVLMVTAALYYAFLAIFAQQAPPQIVGNIAMMIPFWVVYVLVLLNTVVCLWRRLPTLTRELAATPLADDFRPRWHEPVAEGSSEQDVAKLMRGLGYTRPREHGSDLLGVRRRWGALGTFVFHGAFLLVATGFFLSFAYRHETKLTLAVGEYHAGEQAAFRVESMEPEFWGNQLLFTKLEADLFLDGGQHPRIRINRPLWLGWRSFLRLSNFGYAPVYELVDKRGTLLESAVVKLAVFPPGQTDHFRLTSFPHHVYLTVYSDATTQGDTVENHSFNLKQPVIAARVARGKQTVAKALLRPGDELTFEGLSLRIPEIRYYGEFSVLSDPGALFLLLGFLIGFAGLLVRAGGRRAEVLWVPNADGRGGELRGFGTAEPPGETPDEPRPAIGRWAVPGTVLTLAVCALWIARWLEAGHLPLFGTHESSLSLAVAVMLTSWWWEYRARFRSGAGPVAALVVAALILHGYTFDRSVYALTISERSWVVDVHAVLAWAAFGVLATNAGLALRTLLARSAPSALHERAVSRSLELGFVLHTAMMISGAIYKFMLFGKAWSFDPIETLGFVAWMSYGTLVHLVRFAHWDGRRLAKWCLFLFVLLLVSYRIIVYYPAWSSYHILDMDLRMHLV